MMNLIRSIKSTSAIIFITIFGFFACSDIPATNPYDPQTPESSQASGSLLGQLVINDLQVDSSFFSSLNVELFSTSPNASLIDSSTPSPEGRFIFPDLVAGSYQLKLNILGFSEVFREVIVSMDEQTDLGQIVLFPQTQELSAQVSLSNQSDAGGIYVQARHEQVLRDSTNTAPDGSFILRLLPETHSLTFSKPGYFSQMITVEWAEGEFLSNDGPLNELVSLIPIPELTATVRGRLETESPIISWSDGAQVKAVFDGGESPAIIQADDSGANFEIGNVPLGLCLIEIKVLGHQSVSLALTITDENDYILDPIVLRSEPVTVQAIANLTDSTSHSDIVVRAHLGEELVATTLTDEEGRFALTLTPQNHRLSFHKDGYYSSEAIIRWFEQEFVIDSEESGQVIRLSPNNTIEQLEPQPQLRARLNGSLASVLPIQVWNDVSQITLVGEESYNGLVQNLENGGGLSNSLVWLWVCMS